MPPAWGEGISATLSLLSSRAEVFPVEPKRLVLADDGLNVVGQFAGEGFDDNVGVGLYRGIFGVVRLAKRECRCLDGYWE